MVQVSVHKSKERRSDEMSQPTGIYDDELMVRMLVHLDTDGHSIPFLRFLRSEQMQSLVKFMNESSADIIDQSGMVKQIFKVAGIDKDAVSKDAWSYGQLKSKMWLVKTISEFDLDLGNIWILCGWIGTLPLLMHHFNGSLKYKCIRSFDKDQRCASLAETLNRPIVKDEWKFKATTMDINKILYDDFNYETLRYDGSPETLYERADTIINTSCEHLSSDEWWDNIPSGKLVVLQSNDFFEHDDHENPVSDVGELVSRYPMTELMFTGEIDCVIYKRFMIIGRK